MDAAIAVCSDGIESVAEGVDALVAKSLALREDTEGGSRFRFLATTAEYASAALESSGEGAGTRERHLQYYIDHPHQPSGSEVELDNHKAALRFAFEATNYEDAARLIKALFDIAWDSAALVEFSDDIRKTIGSGQESLGLSTQAILLQALGRALFFGDCATSARAAQSAAKLYRAIGDGLGFATAVWDLARAQVRANGRADAALETELLLALEEARGAGNTRLVAGLLATLGSLFDDYGRASEGRACYEEALAIVNRSDIGLRALALNGAGRAAFWAGEVDRAVALWRQGVAIAEETRPWNAAYMLGNVGLGETARGDYHAARIALRKASAELRSYGDQYAVMFTFDFFAELAGGLSQYERAARLAGYVQSRQAAGFVRQVRLQARSDAFWKRYASNLRPTCSNEPGRPAAP